MPRSAANRASRILAAAALLLVAGRSAAAPAGSVDGEAVLDEVAALVEERFYDPEFRGVDWPARVEHHRPAAAAAESPDALAEVINALLAELGTSHTSYHPPSRTSYYDLLDIFNQGEFAGRVREVFPEGVVHYRGVGIVTRSIDGRTFIADIIETSPAAGANLLVGDEIVDADGRPFHPIESCRDREEVVLGIRRHGPDDELMAVPVRPRRIVPHELYLAAETAGARIIDHQGRRLAYVRIRSYAGLAYHEALEELVTVGPLADADGLLLDLRGGWGGANPSYLNLFHRRVPELTMRTRDGETIRLTTRWARPVALLADGGTRSGKEVLAYAFRAHGIGPVIGTRTAGAVVGGSPFLLADHSLLFLATADALVDGVRLEGVGVAPDVEVQWSLPYSRGRDPQLRRAVQVVAGGIDE